MGRFITNAAPAQQNDDWKASGFLNLSLPRKNKDGTISYVKLGTGIPLRASKPGEKKLDEMCRKDPTAAAAMILKHLRVEYRSAEPGEAPDFAFE
jgi:hypothetical protein